MVVASKECSRCKVLKPLEDFYKSKKSKDGHGYSCKKCDEARRPERAKRDPIKWAETMRRGHYRRNYGITIEDYDSMLYQQQGQCAICGSTSASSDASERFHIDHDHSTGRVRALLCARCNMGLGNFKDDPVLLQLAANYLRDHSQVEVIA